MSLDAMPPNLLDRLATAVRELIRIEFPNLTYDGLWEYVVVSVNDDGTIDGAPTDPTIPLPSMARVPIASLACGGTSKPTAGTTFLVEFFNESGTRYAMVGADAVDVANVDAKDVVNLGPTASVNLGPNPAKSVARTGDGITVFLPTGLLNGLLQPDGPGPPPKIPITNLPIQILNPLPGLIVGGNTQVLL